MCIIDSHIAQETVRLYGKIPYIAFPLPTSLIDATVVRLHVRMQLAETGEIYVVKQNWASLVHRLEIEFSRNLIDQLVIERIFPPRDLLIIVMRNVI